MWYTVESNKSTIRNEGEQACRLIHKNLSEMFRLPAFNAVSVGLSGDFSGLAEWAEDANVAMLPFTFEKDRQLKFDLVPRGGNTAVGSVCYGASDRITAANNATIKATFGETSDAKEVLEMFYPHWLISYSQLGSDYVRMSIREVVEKLQGGSPGRQTGFAGPAEI